MIASKQKLVGLFQGEWWKKTVFDHGGHGNDDSGEAVCALEALNFALRGEVTDSLPCGARPTMGVLITINDMRDWWKSDKERTTYLKPWVEKFAMLPKNAKVEYRAVLAAVDYLARTVLKLDVPPVVSGTDAGVLVEQFGDHSSIYWAAYWASEGNSDMSATSVASAIDQEAELYRRSRRAARAFRKKHITRVLEILTEK